MRRGQVSFEFLMVTAVALTILTATTLFMFTYVEESQQKSAAAQAAAIGYKVIDEASNVYTFGTDSFVTVTGSMPEEIRRVYVVDNTALVFELGTLRGIQNVVVFSPVPINGTTIDGNVVRVNNNTVTVHPGRTSYRITSKGTWVEVMQTG